MRNYELEKTASSDNFTEAGYLAVNPDVADAVKSGEIETGRQHFELFGQSEGRKLRLDKSVLAGAKRVKLQKIRQYLRQDMPCGVHDDHLDFLTEDLKRQFSVKLSENISCHGYDDNIMQLLDKHAGGLVLDIGAGRRPVYYENVVNYEVELFDTTDVRGVAERLPFIDNTFDCIISVAVLEHVKDPFLCAREIARTLKPGGVLACSTAFLQPLHAYPNHYYNMTRQGLINLFDDLLVVDDVSVIESLLPVWSLSWILQKWVEGLQGTAREEFLHLRISDLLDSPEAYIGRAFVRELSREKNCEIASGFFMKAHKPLDQPG